MDEFARACGREGCSVGAVTCNATVSIEGESALRRMGWRGSAQGMPAAFAFCASDSCSCSNHNAAIFPTFCWLRVSKWKELSMSE